VLYIRGHSSPGSDTLESGDHRVKIDVDGLVALLDGKLARLFAGKIKIFACDSGNDSNDGAKSFAFKFGNKMSDAGWVRATFWGYQDSLATYVSDAGSDKRTTSGARASSVQIQVPTNHNH
jgi:hypothetical protein